MSDEVKNLIGKKQRFQPKVDWRLKERYPRYPYHYPRPDLRKLFNLLPKKIILLGASNLEILRGYKAHVDLDSKNGEIIITITGLKKTSKDIFDSLEELTGDEIHET